jgi:amidohydrolase
MDGLPVQEATGLPFASERPGFMHACGHDAHMAALLGAAALLAEESAAGRLGFRVRLLFQPGEEGYGGARELIAAGALEGVTAIAGGHVGWLSDEMAPGQAGFLPGPMMAASDRFRGAFTGPGGHGSAPHRTPDPVVAFSEYVMALQAFRSREIDQVEPAVVSVCAVHGGAAYNVIPDRVEFLGTARSLSPRVRELEERRLGEIGASIARLHGLGFDYEWLEGGYPPLLNDPRATEIGMEVAGSILGPGRVLRLAKPIMGGEDFAYYLEKLPGFFFFVDTRNPGQGIVHPNHDSRFDLDEARLPELSLLLLGMAAGLAGTGRLAAGRKT